MLYFILRYGTLSRYNILSWNYATNTIEKSPRHILCWFGGGLSDCTEPGSTPTIVDSFADKNGTFFMKTKVKTRVLQICTDNKISITDYLMLDQTVYVYVYLKVT